MSGRVFETCESHDGHRLEVVTVDQGKPGSFRRAFSDASNVTSLLGVLPHDDRGFGGQGNDASRNEPVVIFGGGFNWQHLETATKRRGHVAWARGNRKIAERPMEQGVGARETMRIDRETDPSQDELLRGLFGTLATAGSFQAVEGEGLEHVMARVQTFRSRLLTHYAEDGEDLPDEATISRSVTFVLDVSRDYLAVQHRPPLEPVFTPGPDASVDVTWRVPGAIVVANIPADPDRVVAIYGRDNRGAQDTWRRMRVEERQTGGREYVLSWLGV